MHVCACMCTCVYVCNVVIIQFLSVITAGSPMVGTPIIFLVRRPINPGLIIDRPLDHAIMSEDL